MGDLIITTADTTHPDMHSSKVIIHGDFGIELASFPNMAKLDEFAKLLGFTYKQVAVWRNPQCGIMKRYAVSHLCDDPWDRSFWHLSDLPDGVKMVILEDNGHPVNCYFLNDGKTIHIYRPNPNVPSLHTTYKV